MKTRKLNSRFVCRTFLIGLVAVAITAGALGSPAAIADHYPQTRTAHCHYKTVTIYVDKTVPYQKRVKRYTPCGNAYFVWKTYYRTVQVPKRVRIRVYK